ncbi:MAG: dipeptidase [Burkholderiaceae bacterium]
MTDHLAEARRILQDTLVIDTLGGAVVHPTPYVEEGTTYEEQVLGYGWSAMNACLVSEPTYNATFDEVLKAMYENFLYFEMSPRVKHVETVDDLLAAKANGQLGVFFGLQSGSCLEQDRKRLRILHKLGLRVLQLTYMERNAIGDGCLEPANLGLSHYGIQVVRDCNRVGVLVDCSHVGIQTTLDAAHHSSKPIVVSHSACRTLADNPRCVTDEQMKAVADKGGTIGITPYGPFIRTDRKPQLEDYLAHFDYAIKLIGADHVTVATDMFDGKTKVNWATPWYYPEITRGAQYGTRRVEGFSRKSDLASFTAGLLRHGHSEETVRKVLGGNFMRVLREVWK